MAVQRSTRVFAGGAYYVTKTGARYRGGLFRSAAGDAHWQSLQQGLPDKVEARVIVFHPSEPDVVYAGTQDGPYRSVDGGEHWERLGFPDRGAVVWSIAFHPTRPKVMYLGTAPVALYRSEDGGDTWSRLPGAVSPEHCIMRFPTRTVGIAVDPGRPDDVYAALEVSGVLRSSDGGESWTDLSAPLIQLAEQPHLRNRGSSDSDASGMLDSHAITVSAARSGEPFLAVRMGIFRGESRGAAWTDIGIGRFSPLTYCRDVLVSPHDPRVMYACLAPASRSKDGSLYRSNDAGETWARFDHGVKANATMMAAAVHPRDPGQVCCVSRCGEVFVTTDSGASWQASKLPEAVEDVYTVACG